ncbi:hypothetical protein Bd3535 [Bdellovibrio bacteriovorus HD100]|uniref:Uncharacterized protein n=1 Tax=Bdellovibrio bacteriovorus (strain ATCC 15356 / DSM 50701 / NCIMB 9529 / HD100) TaxID=264462 RepID=Q6MHK6_BDEBA|nr:hypothetical protein Bd3535 [Bdellovibrio bacteriovorus HD100]
MALGADFHPRFGRNFLFAQALNNAPGLELFDPL